MTAKPQIVGLEAEQKKLYVKNQQRQWYLANAEKKKKYVRNYYAAHKKERIEKAKEYRKKRPEVTLASRLKCNYGLSINQFNEILLQQNNKCAICGILLNGQKKATTPHVDHCHKTGRVRGILCSWCNASLGHLERPGFLGAATMYLGIK